MSHSMHMSHSVHMSHSMCHCMDMCDCMDYRDMCDSFYGYVLSFYAGVWIGVIGCSSGY